MRVCARDRATDPAAEADTRAFAGAKRGAPVVVKPRKPLALCPQSSFALVLRPNA